MMIKKNKNLDFFLNKNIDLILSLFFFIIIFLFFLKSSNYSFFWFKYFKASLDGLINDQIFWDFEVYKCAANKLITNQNPYALLTECSPSKKPFILNTHGSLLGFKKYLPGGMPQVPYRIYDWVTLKMIDHIYEYSRKF